MERNKIIAAVLVALLLLRGINLSVEAIFHKDVPTTTAWASVEPAAAVVASKQEAEPPIAELLLTADASKGPRIFRKCSACHTITADGKSKVGPPLWGVVNRLIAAVPGYNYSKVLADAGSAGSTWNDETLNKFLLSPKADFRGTKMAFAGLKKASDRANLIAWMKEQASGN